VVSADSALSRNHPNAGFRMITLFSSARSLEIAAFMSPICR
jgi:hypothetical protein